MIFREIKTILILLSLCLFSSTTLATKKKRLKFKGLTEEHLSRLAMKASKKDLSNSRIILAYDFSDLNLKSRNSFFKKKSYHDLPEKKENPYESLSVLSSIVFKTYKARSLDLFAFSDQNALESLEGAINFKSFKSHQDMNIIEASAEYRNYSSQSIASAYYDYTAILKLAYKKPPIGCKHTFLIVATPLNNMGSIRESFAEIRKFKPPEKSSVSIHFIDISDKSSKQDKSEKNKKIIPFISENLSDINKIKNLQVNYYSFDSLLEEAERKTTLYDSTSFLISSLVKDLEISGEKEKEKEEEEEREELSLESFSSSSQTVLSEHGRTPNPLEDEAMSLLQALETSGYMLEDMTCIIDTPLLTLAKVKEALSFHIGHGLSYLPRDEEIISDLRKLYMTLNEFHEKAYITDSTSNLKHTKEYLEKKIVGKSYQLRLKEIEYDRDFNSSHFYLDIYNQLSADQLMNETKYPDPDDQRYNRNKKEKENDLINLLADIKNPYGRNELNNRIHSTRSPYYRTEGQTAEWFAEQRYKLYFISKSIKTLSSPGKQNLLSYLIHAGRHCCDAKQAAIEDLFKHFCPREYTRVKSEELEYASSLKDRILYLATLEKMSILDRLIKSEIEKIIKTRKRDNLPRRFSIDYLEKERVTFETATWDHYADRFGVPKKTTQWLNMHITLSTSFTSSGNYTPRRLFRFVSSHNKEQILEETVGCLKYLYSDHDGLILGWLQKEGFLKPNYS